jgi:uncharacterized protein YcbK (DUF882 family)
MKEDPYASPRSPLLPRRTVLTALSALAVSAALPSDLLAATPVITGTAAPGHRPRRLKLRHLHTGERIDIAYAHGERYDHGALAEINHFLRDHRDDTVHPIDPEVIDFLHALAHRLKVDKPIQIICGYRSPKSNALLRARSTGVAKRSLHLEGRAIDIRVPGRSVKAVARAALSLRRGGVGKYTKSNFVHIDCGRFRTWGA